MIHQRNGTYHPNGKERYLPFCCSVPFHLGQCIVETLYNTSCIADKLNGTQSIQENEINSCLIDKDAGYG